MNILKRIIAEYIEEKIRIENGRTVFDTNQTSLESV